MPSRRGFFGAAAAGGATMAASSIHAAPRKTPTVELQPGRYLGACH